MARARVELASPTWEVDVHSKTPLEEDRDGVAVALTAELPGQENRAGAAFVPGCWVYRLTVCSDVVSTAPLTEDSCGNTFAWLHGGDRPRGCWLTWQITS